MDSQDSVVVSCVIHYDCCKHTMKRKLQSVELVYCPETNYYKGTPEKKKTQLLPPRNLKPKARHGTTQARTQWVPLWSVMELSPPPLCHLHTVPTQEAQNSSLTSASCSQRLLQVHSCKSSNGLYSNHL